MERNHQLGISSLSFPWAVGVSKGPRLKQRLTAMELLENARRLGVGLVHFANNLPIENLPWETMVKMKRIATENDIKIEVGTTGVEPDHLLKFLEIATFLHSPVLSTLPVMAGSEPSLDDLEKKLHSVIPEFEKAGVTIVIENQEDYNSSDLAGLMKRIDHPNVKICLDLSNSLGAMEGPVYVLEKLGPFCGSLLFRDVIAVRSQDNMGFYIEGRPVGQGQLPVEWILEQLRANGVRPNTLIGLWPPWQGDIESTVFLEEKWVVESIEYLNRFF